MTNPRFPVGLAAAIAILAAPTALLLSVKDDAVAKGKNLISKALGTPTQAQQAQPRRDG